MSSPKIDYKKSDKNYYLPKGISLIELPALNYLMIDGKGAPTSPAFQEAIALLYATAYMISMSYRNSNFTIENFQPFVVPPLEGLWTSKNEPIDGKIDKNDFIWRLMLRMPDFVNDQVIEKAKKLVEAKKGLDLSGLEFGKVEDGLCLQALHVGSFDQEGETFEKLFAYAEKHDLKAIHKEFHHREIYISDFRKTAAEKLKTTVRIFVEKGQEK
ncbi:hypothetical protein RU89_GL000023 [Lactococcus cremoris]|uniref:GyrI-like domain-containing protein n=1 Tax=Lactococcus lactis subsp. cremoris TaxID=1359 RepID=A0A1V0PJN4_LACLC|nr:GyrI-like domain-containing protein [Lactococcus cremoris]MDU1526927.1 GyrI-like domain-containing protein [Lactococcus lactis]ARE29481.1 GyrI-like domain-containing protein [Lactococcus cremoris]EUN34398.1 AraC-binding domain-containing protein [Lactococcus cremoris subsp. cremoris HP]KZK14439.1 hypothetical protein AB995_0024 [Lactococcus cremoris]KZK41622.1 hypothetical protein N41_0297 [Lactococcus cremoris]